LYDFIDGFDSLTSGIIPIGISVPEVGTDNDYDLPYRIIKMAIEQPVRGKNDVPHYLQFGHLPGYRFKPYYANTAGISNIPLDLGSYEPQETRHQLLLHSTSCV
jgi:hypothetical protein